MKKIFKLTFLFSTFSSILIPFASLKSEWNSKVYLLSIVSNDSNVIIDVESNLKQQTKSTAVYNTTLYFKDSNENLLFSTQFTLTINLDLSEIISLDLVLNNTINQDLYKNYYELNLNQIYQEFQNNINNILLVFAKNQSFSISNLNIDFKSAINQSNGFNLKLDFQSSNKYLDDLNKTKKDNNDLNDELKKIANENSELNTLKIILVVMIVILIIVIMILIFVMLKSKRRMKN